MYDKMRSGKLENYFWNNIRKHSAFRKIKHSFSTSKIIGKYFSAIATVPSFKLAWLAQEVICLTAVKIEVFGDIDSYQNSWVKPN